MEMGGGIFSGACLMPGEVRKGWWKVSVSNRVYDRLERIKKEFEREAGGGSHMIRLWIGWWRGIDRGGNFRSNKTDI
jgi:hypothetical protein